MFSGVRKMSVFYFYSKHNRNGSCTLGGKKRGLSTSPPILKFGNVCNVTHRSTSSLTSGAERQSSKQPLVVSTYMHRVRHILFCASVLSGATLSAESSTGEQLSQPLSVSAAQFRQRQGNSWQLGGLGPAPAIWQTL